MNFSLVFCLILYSKSLLAAPTQRCEALTRELFFQAVGEAPYELMQATIKRYEMNHTWNPQLLEEVMLHEIYEKLARLKMSNRALSIDTLLELQETLCTGINGSFWK